MSAVARGRTLVLHTMFEFIFNVFGYYIGLIIVSVFTLGRIKCDRIFADSPRRKFRWSGTHLKRGQQIYLTSEAMAGIGLIFATLVIGCGFLIYY